MEQIGSGLSHGCYQAPSFFVSKIIDKIKIYFHIADQEIKFPVDY